MNPTAIEGIVQVTSCNSCSWNILLYFCSGECTLTSCHVQPALGPDGKRKELESNVLLASIENMQYAVTVDVLHTVRVMCFPHVKL